MERRQLEYFVAVVQHGGFSRAAEAEHVSQPSLSQAIGALEKDLGTALFHRIGRTVKLTSAGEALLPSARQILRDHAVAHAAVAKVRGGLDGVLDLASTPTIASHPLTAILGRYAAGYRQVRINITDADIPGGADLIVGGGQCELGVVHLPVKSNALVSIPLGRQVFYLVLPPGRPDPGPGPVDLAFLGSLPLITTPFGTPSRRRLDDALRLAGFDGPQVILETIYRASIVKLVVAGVGAAFLPDHLAQEAAALGAIARVTTPLVTHEIGIVRREGPLSPAAAAFIDVALDMAPFGMDVPG